MKEGVWEEHNKNVRILQSVINNLKQLEQSCIRRELKLDLFEVDSSRGVHESGVNKDGYITYEPDRYSFINISIKVQHKKE